jgi:hypothetical protein
MLTVPARRPLPQAGEVNFSPPTSAPRESRLRAPGLIATALEDDASIVIPAQAGIHESGRAPSVAMDASLRWHDERGSLSRAFGITCCESLADRGETRLLAKRAQQRFCVSRLLATQGQDRGSPDSNVVHCRYGTEFPHGLLEFRTCGGDRLTCCRARRSWGKRGRVSRSSVGARPPVVHRVIMFT